MVKIGKEKFIQFKNETIHWLNEREHRPYKWKRRFNYLLTIFAVFFFSIVAYKVFYSNIGNLYGIKLWIINLGGVLLLVSLFFIIKYGWKILKEIPNIIKRQRNWIRWLIIILLIFGAWQIYQNKEDVLNPLINYKDNTNFSYFNPLSLSNFNFFEGDNSSNKSLLFETKKIIKQDPEMKEESIEAFNYLNQLRAEKKLRIISWDERAYKMAVERSKDMYERNYFSHLTPEGKCMQTLKLDYGFSSRETVAENIWMISGGRANPQEALNSWITSPGHYANLFYKDHVKGAIGCYERYCAFNGVHNDPYGLGAAPCSAYE
jgi:uncharacterized protein YkwD